MIRIFSVLASANAIGLLASFAFGLLSMQRHSLENGDDWLFTAHFLCGLFTAVATLLVHCLIFTYFLGTGRWVREVTLAYDLPDEPLYKTTRVLKRKTFPPALFAMLSVIAVAAAGGGRQLQDWPYQIHLYGAVGAIVLNFWAYWVEIRDIRRNEDILAGVYREVDRVRAERGLPTNEESLRMEAETTPSRR
jgi:phosphoglycerol transferase MdoB-like AlkP superfamily enzyme